MNTPLNPRRKARVRVALVSLVSLALCVFALVPPPQTLSGLLGAAMPGASFLYGAWIFARWNRPGLFNPFDWRRIR